MAYRLSRTLVVSLFCLAAFAQTAPAQVRAEETRLEIPTYYLGPDDPNPPLWNERIYPYPMQTDLEDRVEQRRHRAVVLENDYIRVIVLPDLGGRILAALDKTNDDFDFIYRNHVVKPGLVALRGAWISGGIEWNFPTLGHTVDTFSPVNYRLIEGADGSVTCVVGTEEWVRRMKWEVFITLYPDRSHFKTRARLYNKTLTHNNGYYWSNAAAHAWDDTRIVLPPTEFTFFGKRRNPRPWPVHEGVDATWYRNTVPSSDFFCATPGDYHGSYNTRRDNGTIHCAGRYQSPGKKFWTWGVSPRGELWKRLLTDGDGAYIEIQGGRLTTQGDTWVFEPHLVEEMEEYWFPVKKMGGFVKANPDAAVNLEALEGRIRVGLNVTRVYENGKLVLTADGREALARDLTIGPAGYFYEELDDTWKAAEYEISFFDAGAGEVISYSTRHEEIPAPELQPDLSGEAGGAEELFLRGYYALKDWNREAALSLFRRALEIDPGFTAAHKWMGIVLFKTGGSEEALAHFQAALERNEDDYDARYYRALCTLRLGRTEGVEYDLHLVSRRAAYRHVAPYVLAGFEIGRGRLEAAADLLETSTGENTRSTLPRVMLAAVLRRLGRDERALALLDAALQIDPLDSPALIEKHLLTGRSELELLRGNQEIYLETAIEYARMNLTADAAGILETYVSSEGAKADPILLYHLWMYHDLLGDRDRAESRRRAAVEASPDYVFPFRAESEQVLRLAAKADPADWKARYYLGNLLTANLRWREGLEYFLDAAAAAPPFPVLYRNIGQVYWRKLQQPDKAAAAYETAVRYGPEDYTLYLDLDELYFAAGRSEEREALLAGAPEAVRGKPRFVLALARLHLDSGKFTVALATLETSAFKPWEGDRGLPREVYLLSLLGRSEDKLRRGDFEGAAADLETAMEYPENLGTERPADPAPAMETYLLARCLEKQGDIDKARELYSAAARFEPLLLSPHQVFKALALRKIGKQGECESALGDLLIACEESLADIEGSDRAPYLQLAALAAWASGKLEAGDACMKESLELSPGDRWSLYFSTNKSLFVGPE